MFEKYICSIVYIYVCACVSVLNEFCLLAEYILGLSGIIFNDYLVKRYTVFNSHALLWIGHVGRS